MRARLPAVALLLMGGALYAAAFPPHDWNLCAWIALVPLLSVAAGSRRRDGFAAGALYGAAFFAMIVPWVVEAVRAYFTGSLFAAPCFSGTICVVFVSGYVGLFALGARRLLAGAPWIAVGAVPALWVVCELARATLLSGLPWELLGHSQWRWIDLIQIADWGGVYALSYLVAAVNVALYLGLRAAVAPLAPQAVIRAALPLVATLALVGASIGYGRSRVAAEAARTGTPSATIALLQGNHARTPSPNRLAFDRTIGDYPEGLPLVLPELTALAGLGAGAQHLSIAVFRAVETWRYLARAATAGISGFVDPVRRPFALTAAGTRSTTTGQVEMRRELTLYVRWGDVFAFSCVAVSLGSLLVPPRRVLC